jgi:Arc/MetJ-type ribon-helix-helix transcriptional regulator
VCVIPFGSGCHPRPPHPGEPVPSVPPVGESDGSPLRYGGFRAASCACPKDHILGDAYTGGMAVEKKRQLIYIMVLFSGSSALRGESMEKEFMTISIPTSLYKKIEEVIKGTEVSSVSSYITKVLREKLSQEKEAGEVFSKEDEEKVKERLKALGYID